MTHIIKHSRYPNNEIRVVHYWRCERKPQAGERSNSPCEDSIPGTARDRSEVFSEASFPNLDISSDFAKPVRKNPHKRTSFGRDAKNTILRIGGAYDTIDKKPENYVFLTGTIPGGTHDAFMAIAEESPYIVRSIADWLRQTAPTEHWFYCWELQKRGALHIHYCLHCPDTAIRDKVLSGWKQKWSAVLDGVQKKTAVDCWLRADGSHHRSGRDVLQAYAQKVRKSVAAYMAAYCSGVENKHALDFASPYYPKRWWGCSRKTSSLLKALTEEVISEYDNYKDARFKMLTEYERISADTEIIHRYPHKVGIGSTIVSYHPSDKGEKTWHPVKQMQYRKTSHPNVYFLIQTLRQTFLASPTFLRLSQKHSKKHFSYLLTDLQDSHILGSLSRSTLSQRHVRVFQALASELKPTTLESQCQKLFRSSYVPTAWILSRVSGQMTWDRNGWLVMERDFDIRLTEAWWWDYGGTTDERSPGSTWGAANGSISPQHPPSPPSQLCLFSDLSEHPPLK